MPRRGRPSVYTPEIADEICRRLADGEGLVAICRDKHMPAEAAVRKWALDDREGFYARYARAREIQAERWADEIIDIADGDGDWQRARLRVDTRKWLVAKVLPKKYGERVDHNVSGGVTVKIVRFGDHSPE